jgi:hypothetical protein
MSQPDTTMHFLHYSLRASSCKIITLQDMRSWLTRASYTESVGLLYSNNTFDFRRSATVIRLPHVMLPHRFQQLNRVQFSTAFSCYGSWGQLPQGLPADFWELPDDRHLWEKACQVLASFNHLGYLRITIEMMCRLEQHKHPVDASLLLEILLPLKAVSAKSFVVEIPEDISSVRERLGEVPFLIKRL